MVVARWDLKDAVGLPPLEQLTGAWGIQARAEVEGVRRESSNFEIG